MHFEALDARRLMDRTYVAGRDPTFGDDGRVTFADGFVAGNVTSRLFDNHFHTITSGNGNTFVAGSNGRHNYVVKIGSDGQIDPSFGKHGYAAVPYPATQLAYEPRTGSLYVGEAKGRDTYALHSEADGDVLYVTRLRPNGRLDKAFATNGTFSYRPPVPTTGDGAIAVATVEAINPLPDGSAVLAVDRQTRASDADEHVADQSLALFKLRANGTRDLTYGRRGVVQLIGGTFGGTDGDEHFQEYTVPTHRGFFSDVQTNRHGTTTVVIRYGAGTTTHSDEVDYYDSQMADQGRIDLKLRNVSAAGVVDEETAYSWKLVDDDDDEKFYQVAYAGTAGDGVQAVVHDVTAPPGDPYDVTTTTYVYTLRPGERPARRVLAPGGIDVTSSFYIGRSPGGPFVVSDAEHVVRLHSDLRRDSTFTALDGAYGTYSFYDSDDGPYIDPSGRVLTFEDYGGPIERFA